MSDVERMKRDSTNSAGIVVDRVLWVFGLPLFEFFLLFQLFSFFYCLRYMLHVVMGQSVHELIAENTEFILADVILWGNEKPVYVC
jgi:hypothetical protein